MDESRCRGGFQAGEVKRGGIHLDNGAGLGHLSVFLSGTCGLGFAFLHH